MGRVLRCALLLYMGTMPLGRAQAQAQAPAPVKDDWAIERSPFDPRLVKRYQDALERDPDDALALRKLVELYKKYRSLGELVQLYKEKRSPAGRAVYADLLVHQLGKPDEALAVLEAVPGHPPKIDARLGELYRKAGRPAQARAAWERALAQTPGVEGRKGLLRGLADLALADKDFPAAEKFYDQLVALEPANLRLRLEFADALGRQGEKTRALAELERAAKTVEHQGNPQLKAEILSRLGEAAEAAGQEEHALATYRKALSALPRDHYLRRELLDKVISVYRRQERMRELVAQLEKEWGQRGFLEWETLARLYDELGEQDRAETAFRHAIAVQPSALETRTRYIALLDRLGRESDALREHEKLAALAPGEPKFQLSLAERLLRGGERKRGLALLGTLDARFRGDAGVHSALADLYQRYGESDLALVQVERLVKLEPGDESHLIALGEQWFERGNKKRALEIWRRLLTAIPKKEQALMRLGDVLADHDMAAEALDLYDKAQKLAPKDAQIRRGIAQVLERQKRIDDAVAAWEKVGALASEPGQAALRREARSRIIALLAKEHRLGSRLLPYQGRFAAKPPDIEAGYFLAEAYTKLGQLDLAEKTLREILRLQPSDTDALLALVQVLRAGGKRLGDAIAVLKRIAELQPGRARDVYIQIADLSLLLYQDEQAVQAARRAVEIAPQDPAAHLRLAEIHEKRDDLDAAIASYRNAIERNPRQWKAQFALARLLARHGQLREAALVYRELIARAPEEEIVLEAAHKALDLEEYLGTLGELEKELRPLEFSHAERPVYRRVLVELYERYVPALIEQTRGAPAPARQAALQGMGEHGLRPLLEALGDPSAGAQKIAAEILGHLGNRGASAALLRLAAGGPTGDPPQKPDIDLRVGAALAAGRLADPAAIGALERLLGDREVVLRQAAAWGLGRMSGGAPAAGRALTAALGDPKAEVAALACLALGQHPGAKALGPLLAVVRDDARDDLTRAGCALALGRLGDPAALPALGNLLDRGGVDAQRAAALALGMLGGRGMEPALVRALFIRREPVRRAALWALHKPVANRHFGLPDSLEAPDGKPDTRAYLSQVESSLAASQAEQPVAIAPLVETIRRAMGEALTRHHDLVLRTLQDIDSHPTCVALGPLGAPSEAKEVVAPLAQEIALLASHADAAIRAPALRILAKLGDEKAESALGQALADRNPEVGRAAVQSAALYLAQAPTRASALATLLSAHLRALDWPERLAAARALAATPAAAKMATPFLAQARADKNGFVAEAATEALRASR